MNFCADYEERLNEFLDEEISPAARAEVERHLEGCAGCREYLAALRSLRERAASLPRTQEPERDLWPEIRESLPSRRSGTFRPIPGLPSWAAGWGGLVPAAATIVVVLSIAVALLITLRRSPVPQGPGEAGVPAVASAPAARAVEGGGAVPASYAPQGSLAAAEAEYRAAAEKLLAALAKERPEATPAAVKVIEENLRIVDRAIEEIRRVTVQYPDAGTDERIAIGLYRTRFELLQQAVRLSSRDKKEEKQS